MNDKIYPSMVIRSQAESIELLEKENKKYKDRINDLELIVGTKRKRSLISKFNKEYDEEDKKKNPNRTYTRIEPDAEEIYKRYYDLKKQVEDISEELELVRCDLHNRTSERDGYERELNECLSQQKEFIKYLENEIKLQEEINDIVLATGFEEILQKYRSIIGDDKE